MYDFFKSFQEDKCVEKVKKVFFLVFFNTLKGQKDVNVSVFIFHFKWLALILNSVFQFLDEISSNVSKESSGLEDAVVLKEG